VNASSNPPTLGLELTLSSLVWARTRRVASASPATSGTGMEDDDAASLLPTADTAAAAADTGTAPDDRAHTATAETSRDRAFILCLLCCFAAIGIK